MRDQLLVGPGAPGSDKNVCPGFWKYVDMFADCVFFLSGNYFRCSALLHWSTRSKAVGIVLLCHLYCHSSILCGRIYCYQKMIEVARISLQLCKLQIVSTNTNMNFEFEPNCTYKRQCINLELAKCSYLQGEMHFKTCI